MAHKNQNSLTKNQNSLIKTKILLLCRRVNYIRLKDTKHIVRYPLGFSKTLKTQEDIQITVNFLFLHI